MRQEFIREPSELAACCTGTVGPRHLPQPGKCRQAPVQTPEIAGTLCGIIETPR